MSAFFTLYRGLDREGPGSAADVLWALERGEIGQDARICDAGAGSGADSATLAEARPEARIVAIEKAPSLAAEARRRLGRYANMEVREADMADPGGPWDLIWCAGALYFLGLTEGLSGWRGALAPGGAVAFSEPCYLSDPPAEAARAFWAGYPSVTGLAGIEARVTSAGYVVRGRRMIVGAPWAAYYRPLQARIDALRPGAAPDLTRVLDAAAAEIAAWRAAPGETAYALLLVAPR